MKHFMLKAITLFSLLLLFTNCESKDEETVEPQLATITSDTTSENAVVTYTSITIEGKITSTGGDNITARGVCWGASNNPTINDTTTTEASNTFTSVISGLVANTTYYFRVYATNSAGTSYGPAQSFRTSSLDGTTWDFLITYDSTTSWHADVIFNADGTTVYDEPDYPGDFTSYGTWSLNGNTLTYDLDASDTSDLAYQFTGTLLTNTMSGTFTFGSQPDKNWTAIKY